MQTENFGEHFMLDGYGGDITLLNSKALVLGALNDLPEKLGMKKLAQPVVYFAEDLSQKDPGGWSGFVVIAESHISIHTFAARGFVSIDAYTCKNGMDCTFIEKYFVDLFKLKNTETNFVKRGTRYPSFNLE
ncbi:MAG: S-adenosylmethionine decarboxylase [bacterium]